MHACYLLCKVRYLNNLMYYVIFVTSWLTFGKHEPISHPDWSSWWQWLRVSLPGSPYCGRCNWAHQDWPYPQSLPVEGAVMCGWRGWCVCVRWGEKLGIPNTKYSRPTAKFAQTALSNKKIISFLRNWRILTQTSSYYGRLSTIDALNICTQYWTTKKRSPSHTI